MMRCLGSKADGQRDGVQGAVAYGSVLPDWELCLRLEATVCPAHWPQSAVWRQERGPWDLLVVQEREHCAHLTEPQYPQMRAVPEDRTDD